MLLSLAFVLVASSSNPQPVAIAAGKDHYFGADAGTGAEYLNLGAGGRYTVVNVEHMFTEVGDTGRWRVEGRSIVLESDSSVRDIDLGEFHVHIFDRCGQEALPELREAIRKLRAKGERIKVNEFGDVVRAGRTGHPLGRGPGKDCGASLGYLPDEYPAKPLRAKQLDPVLAAIDAWLADAAAQNIFEYTAWEYRGERFLVPMRAGMHAVQETEADVKELMDRYDGHRASYVYYRISAEEFAKRANCTYAFKHYPQMNAQCNEG